MESVPLTKIMKNTEVNDDYEKETNGNLVIEETPIDILNRFKKYYVSKSSSTQDSLWEEIEGILFIATDGVKKGIFEYSIECSRKDINVIIYMKKMLKEIMPNHEIKIGVKLDYSIFKLLCLFNLIPNYILYITYKPPVLIKPKVVLLQK